MRQDPHKDENSIHLRYRPDIDGLRAVAVLFVIGFHAFPEYVKGGFIGVDIFFVISGFLISTIIIKSLEQNKFSFYEFYAGRIRRLFPALLLVLVTCFLFGWFLMLDDEFEHLGKHIASGIGFVSNYILRQESGYFDFGIEVKPLLHLWSLGIEEQFYIFWPFLLWICWKLKFKHSLMMICICCISFFLNVKNSQSNAQEAFYSPEPRLWELLIGGILAYSKWPEKWSSQNERIRLLGRNLISVVGAVFLFLSFTLIKKENSFPGWWALLPTLGAAFTIAAGSRAFLNRFILSNRLIVLIGLISFPLYLWHWPLLSFGNIVESETPALSIRTGLVATAFVLAWFTYRWIELPLRRSKISFSRTMTLVSLALLIGTVSYVTYRQQGFPKRSSIRAQLIKPGDVGMRRFYEYFSQHFFPYYPTGNPSEDLNETGYTKFYMSKKNRPVQMIILGDSHAEHLFHGLAEQISNTNIAVYSKLALPSIASADFQKIFSVIEKDTQLKTVFLTSFWSARMGGEFKKEMSATVKALSAAGKQIYLLGDVPHFSFDSRKCKFLRTFSSGSKCTSDAKTPTDEAQTAYFGILKEIALENSRAKLVHLFPYFCESNICRMEVNGIVMYRDYHHLNIEGSRYAAQRIVRDNPELLDEP